MDFYKAYLDLEETGSIEKRFDAKKNDENDIREIVKWAFSFGEPFDLCIENNERYSLYAKVIKRGYYYNKKGESRPSLHTSSVSGNLFNYLEKANLKDRMLFCVNPNSNSGAGNYKKYYIEINSSGDLTCAYGELEKPREECREVEYERKHYWFLYFEKLSKNYTDETTVMKDTVTVIKHASDNDYQITNINEELYSILLSYAEHHVKESLIETQISIKQVEKARKLFEILQTKKTPKGFNTQLQELMKLSPRKRNWKAGESVQQFLAKSTNDFPTILEREEDLLLAMEAVAYNDERKKQKQQERELLNKAPSFMDYDIDVIEPSKEEVDFVKKHISSDVCNQYKLKVYKVLPKKQNANFNEYLHKTHSEVKYLWHGSRCENWASIVKNSLYCPVNATNGRMFGNGIYLAPSIRKSLGYTDGGYWAGGQKKQSQILGLYKTAYNPLTYSKGTSWSYDKDYKTETLSSNHTCLHAKSGDFGLRNDEVIFYNNNAVCLEYLIMLS